MVLAIKEYPVDIDADKLVKFIDTSIVDNTLTKNMDHVSKLTFTDGKDDFLEHDEPMIKHLEWSFYDACSKFWGMDIFDYNISSWVYVDWNNNPIEPYMHSHNPENPFTLSGIMYVKLGTSGTTMFPMPKRDPYYLPNKLMTWFIFPSNLPHTPGKGVEDEKRYSISADLYP